MLAKITLAPGQIGYHDPVSNVHLTLANPTAVVPMSANTTALKEAVRAGTIMLLFGTLSATLDHKELREKEVLSFSKRMNLHRPVVNPNVTTVVKPVVIEEKIEEPELQKENVVLNETVPEETLISLNDVVIQTEPEEVKPEPEVHEEKPEPKKAAPRRRRSHKKEEQPVKEPEIPSEE